MQTFASALKTFILQPGRIRAPNSQSGLVLNHLRELVTSEKLHHLEVMLKLYLI